jgi:hypothetical protein
LEHCLSGWRRGVYALLVQIQINADSVKFTQEAD